MTNRFIIDESKVDCSNTQQSNLALSLSSLAKQDHTLLGRPISFLARKAGLKANDVYCKLLPKLAEESDLLEGLKYAEVGMKYATMIDQNRFREEIGVEFITAIDLIIGLVEEGLEYTGDNKGAVIRKAMLLHRDLIDEHGEKRRFIQTIMVEDKLAEIAAGRIAQEELYQEIIDI
uniref:Uncharacterized protein n=1 Tax=viral metagenome TaxID=1070528 RepID=A0A6M3KZJ1_9ZZZZ